MVEEAITFLRGRIRRTDVEFSPSRSKVAGVPIWLKLEFLQITGSYKPRGALLVHEQVSVPVDVRNGKAILDLTP